MRRDKACELIVLGKHLKPRLQMDLIRFLVAPNTFPKPLTKKKINEYREILLSLGINSVEPKEPGPKAWRLDIKTGTEIPIHD